MNKSLYYPMRDNEHMQVANVSLDSRQLIVKIKYEDGKTHKFERRV